jgi:hypothetical protein
VVNWRSCLDPHADEQIEISASHIGMAVSPRAWRAVECGLKRFRESDRGPASRKSRRRRTTATPQLRRAA